MKNIKLITFWSVVNAMDVFILTDGGSSAAGYPTGAFGGASGATNSRIEWRRAKEWTEFLFHASGILDYPDINAHFISR